MNSIVNTESVNKELIDGFGRKVNYVRISVTDRCDFRCVYCMPEKMQFLPRKEILSLEEIDLIAQAFVNLGVKKIRLTGGEPLIRKNILWLVQSLGRMENLNELTLTTNGSQLTKLAPALREAGMSRINISLDSLNANKFKAITRTGDLDQVIAGIDAARQAGFERIKLNAVILKGRNEDEVLDLVEFARDRQLDITFIEEMPLGEIIEHDRALSFCSSDELYDWINAVHPLEELNNTFDKVTTSGPSTYYAMQDSKSRIGFISPHSHNFCATCNRVRVTVSGRLLLCLGNDHSVDLRAVTRKYPGDVTALEACIMEAMERKPERHYFDLDESPEIVRFMNMTGG